ncbi:uncharacterized protein N7529_000157 [Penicillium soppii]|uniref:uncharacterized protein n=1 Tax=Penicillium soppii TaxID=69789 RepID=UPI002547162D|nr:uncharacterized protein N7529_000157 [Penicillium soppii]KAJ5881485.1 hypothetical protein N7529_000157 [Penicillium soppii]
MMTTKQPEEDSPNVQIRIGDVEYSIDVTKIPYFNACLRFEQSSGQDSADLPTYPEMPFFDVINAGVKHGFRRFFRSIPVQLDDDRFLCKKLYFLCVGVLSGRNMQSIMRDLRSGKSEWNMDETYRPGGTRNLARDSVFRLLYQFMLGDFKSDVSDSNMAYNAVLFVASHREIFKYKTRNMVRAAEEERFDMSEK